MTDKYTPLEKLDILEKEWLPIVIERSYRIVTNKTKAQKMISLFDDTGYMPIWIEDIKDGYLHEDISTFEEYLDSIFNKKYNTLKF